jgi:hypothetical protein
MNLNVIAVAEEVGEAIASPGMTWKKGPPIEDHPEARTFVGTHHAWTIQLVVYGGDMADGGAVNMRRGIVLHLTPALASKARELAENYAVKEE